MWRWLFTCNCSPPHGLISNFENGELVGWNATACKPSLGHTINTPTYTNAHTGAHTAEGLHGSQCLEIGRCMCVCFSWHSIAERCQFSSWYRLQFQLRSAKFKGIIQCDAWIGPSKIPCRKMRWNMNTVRGKMAFMATKKSMCGDSKARHGLWCRSHTLCPLNHLLQPPS